jgi:hypothetical protein
MGIDDVFFLTNIKCMNNEDTPVLPRINLDEIPTRAAKSKNKTARVSAMIKAPSAVSLIEHLVQENKNISAFIEMLIINYAERK